MHTADRSFRWIEQVRLLDDAPVYAADADLLDFGGKVRLVAQSLLHARGPMVVLVEGGWGRGKTSFCRLLERDLEAGAGHAEAPAATARWYIASDDDGDAQDVLLRVVADAVTEGDPAEVQRVVARWGRRDEGPAFDRFEAFRRWVGRTLGQEPAHEATTVEVPLATGTWKIEVEPAKRRLVTIIVDDLDRCAPARVKAVLDAVRAYVACPGLAFVIAADHQVIQGALERTVADLGLGGLRRPADALEKYVRHRVHLPGLANVAEGTRIQRIRQLEEGMFGGRPEHLALLRAPGTALSEGVAVLLANTLGRTLTLRRLKRLLNAIVEDAVGLADLAEIPEGGVPKDEWRTFAALRFEDPAPGDTQAFVERLVERVVHHTLTSIWPEALGGLDGQRRAARLEALVGIGDTDHRWQDAPLREVLAALVPSAVAVPLATARAVCVLLSTLHTLESDDRLVPVEVGPTSSAALDLAPTDMLAQQRPMAYAPEPILTRSGRYRSPPSQAPRAAQPEGPVQPAAAETIEPEAAPAASEAPSSGPLTPDALRSELGRLIASCRAVAAAPTVEADAVGRVLQAADVLVSAAGADLTPVAALFKHVVLVVEAWPPFAQDHPYLLATLGDAAVAAGRLTEAGPLYHAVFEALSRHSGRAWVDLASRHLSYVLATGDHTDLPREALADQANQLMNVVVSLPDWDDVAFRGALLGARVVARLETDGDKSALSQIAPRFGLLLAQLNARFDDDPAPDTALQLLRLTEARGQAPDPVVLKRAQMFVDQSKPHETARLRRALADVLVNTGERRERAEAVALYRSLEGSPQWTPAVLHNLASLIRADEGGTPEVGRLWSAAYRAGSRDGRLLRGFSDYLRAQKQSKLALAVLRGEPLPTDWHPFGEPIDPETVRPEWEADRDA